ncbi:MAG: hypothetical protein ACE5HY_04240 [Candidatus Hydrothermarchaeales archaeon]
MVKEGNYSDFDNKINEFKTDLDEKQKKAINLMQKIVNILADYSGIWYENTAKSIVRGNYETTIGLKKDKLKQLKKDIQDLTEKANAEIKEELMKEDYWPEYYGIEKGRRLEDGLRLILGRLGEVLGKYGYIKDQEVWHEPAKFTKKASKGRPFYPYGLELPDEFLSMYGKYGKVIKEVESLKRNIAQMEREKKEKMALDLWESV